jgi:TonB family protein
MRGAPKVTLHRSGTCWKACCGFGLRLTSLWIRGKLCILTEGQSVDLPGPSMTHHPMPQPESYGTSSPWDKESSDQKSSSPVGEAFSAREVTDVFRTLAAHGGGTASFDLALDLVLNEVVQQAQLATGATGAAIALARAGEMVCRATTGADAPELGVRFEMKSGLSGACLQTATVQQCGDTETDARVDAEACRRLGVRSILVLPLVESQGPFGILEVFSSRPNAFRDRDVDTLQVLARRVVENKRGAEQVAAVFPSVDDKSDAHSNEMKISPDISPDYEQLWESDAKSPIEKRYSRRSEVWTSILGILVIVVAVLLGLALGWRGAIGRGLRTGSRVPANASPATKADRKMESAAEAKNVSAAHPSSVEQPSGGLVVTQNGKVIYRLPPPEQQATPGASAVPEGSGDVATNRLIHRVEPQYPANASARHIQGLVKLDVQVGGDGAVRNITVIEGDPVLAEAAVQAVRQWRYRPYSVDGRPVEMQTTITLNFRLPQ